MLLLIFLDKNFSHEPYLCNGCDDLMQKAINFNDVAIVSVKGNDYGIHFWYISKDDAISIMNNSEKNRVVVIFFFNYIKNEWNNLLSKKQRSDFK